MIHSEVKIVALYRSLLHPANAFRVENGTVQAAGDDEVQDTLAGTVAPGFVDLQVNGFGPRDVLECTPEAITEIAVALLAHGVTAWCPTIISTSEDVRLRALDAIAAAREHNRGARILGAHLEGPWLSPLRAGAHDPAALNAPAAAAIVKSIDHHPGLVRIVTLAPELDGGLDAVRMLAEAGVVVSMGHTNATLDEALAAIDAGARMVTHLFNAMRPLHQRDPGVVGAALTDDRVTCGLIADGTHVHPLLVALTLRSKPGHVALVSDVVSGGGGPVAMLDGGMIAGSHIALDEGVRVAVGQGIEPARAIAAASRVPAALLGEPYGTLDPGAPADFVVLDESLRPAATYVSGELVWSADT